MSIAVEIRMHLRSRAGVAECGRPVKQDQLTDALEDVGCAECMRARAARAKS